MSYGHYLWAWTPHSRPPETSACIEPYVHPEFVGLLWTVTRWATKSKLKRPRLKTVGAIKNGPETALTQTLELSYFTQWQALLEKLLRDHIHSVPRCLESGFLISGLYWGPMVSTSDCDNRCRRSSGKVGTTLDDAKKAVTGRVLGGEKDPPSCLGASKEYINTGILETT